MELIPLSLPVRQPFQGVRKQLYMATKVSTRQPRVARAGGTSSVKFSRSWLIGSPAKVFVFRAADSARNSRFISTDKSNDLDSGSKVSMGNSSCVYECA